MYYNVRHVHYQHKIRTKLDKSYNYVTQTDMD